MIAEGWDVEDTTGKGQRGPLPEEAVVVEQLVGLFDRELSSGGFPASEFNRFAAPRVFSEQDLARVRALKAKFENGWLRISHGAITIEFTPGVPIRAE